MNQPYYESTLGVWGVEPPKDWIDDTNLKSTVFKLHRSRDNITLILTMATDENFNYGWNPIYRCFFD